MKVCSTSELTDGFKPSQSLRHIFKLNYLRMWTLFQCWWKSIKDSFYFQKDLINNERKTMKKGMLPSCPLALPSCPLVHLLLALHRKLPISPLVALLCRESISLAYFPTCCPLASLARLLEKVEAGQLSPAHRPSSHFAFSLTSQIYKPIYQSDQAPKCQGYQVTKCSSVQLHNKWSTAETLKNGDPWINWLLFANHARAFKSGNGWSSFA